jgi:hypothetical protein
MPDNDDVLATSMRKMVMELVDGYLATSLEHHIEEVLDARDRAGRGEQIMGRAWTLFEERLEEKTSWGRNEVKAAMNDCFMQAVKES